MIEERIKILSDYLSKQNNLTWAERKAFNDVVEYCYQLEKNFNDKTIYLERLCSWYIDHMFELYQDTIDEVSFEFIRDIILRKLKLILKSSPEYNYLSIENNILALDIRNGNKLKPYGSVKESMKLFVRDVIVYNTDHKYETT
jgi:hypothetical protein